MSKNYSQAIDKQCPSYLNHIDSLLSFIEDPLSKLNFIVGPKYVEKLAFIKQLNIEHQYLDYDDKKDKYIIDNRQFNGHSVVVIDNCHKKNGWIEWAKEVVKNQNVKLILISHFSLSLFSKECSKLDNPYQVHRIFPLACSDIYQIEMDPLSYLSNTVKQRLDEILRYDLIDVLQFTDIKSMEQLIELLKINIGKTISYADFGRQLDKDPKTIKQWLGILEGMHIIFKVLPYSEGIPRAILKDSKYYFFDSMIIDNNDFRLKNIVAFSLYKYVISLQDIGNASASLHFIRDKQGNEIDFFMKIGEDTQYLIDSNCKTAEASESLLYFSKLFSEVTEKLQLIKGISHNLTYKKSGIKVVDMAKWLGNL